MKTNLKRPFGTACALVLASGLLSTTVFAGEIAHKSKRSGTHVFDMAMKPVLEQYLKVQGALASDSTDGVQRAAKAITTSSAKLDAETVNGEHAEHYKHLPMKIEKAAAALGKATKIDAVREAFKQLSKPMAMWGTMSKPEGVDVLFCSMAKGSWLQKHGDVKNPYYGASMLGCGEVVGGAAHSMKAVGHGEHGGH